MSTRKMQVSLSPWVEAWRILTTQRSSQFSRSASIHSKGSLCWDSKFSMSCFRECTGGPTLLNHRTITMNILVVITDCRCPGSLKREKSVDSAIDTSNGPSPVVKVHAHYQPVGRCSPTTWWQIFHHLREYTSSVTRRGKSFTSAKLYHCANGWDLTYTNSKGLPLKLSDSCSTQQWLITKFPILSWRHCCLKPEWLRNINHLTTHSSRKAGRPGLWWLILLMISRVLNLRPNNCKIARDTLVPSQAGDGLKRLLTRCTEFTPFRRAKRSLYPIEILVHV